MIDQGTAESQMSKLENNSTFAGPAALRGGILEMQIKGRRRFVVCFPEDVSMASSTKLNLKHDLAQKGAKLQAARGGRGPNMSSLPSAVWGEV